MNSQILFKDRDKWRKWLCDNFNKETEIWLIYYKKHTKKESVKQPEAVEEALCYGWIDSIVRRIDDERYMQKFTPRQDKSIWSDLNKKRVKQLIKSRKMTMYGLQKVNIAKRNGMWNKISNTTNLNILPEEFSKELQINPKLEENWNNYAPSHKKQYLYWINSAKRDDTKRGRIEKVLARIAKNIKPGIM